MARPSKYKPEYCEALVQHMNGGLSFESFAGVIKVNRDTLYEWEKRHKAFSDAKKMGETLSLLWWERMGKFAMLGEPVTDKDGRRLTFKNFNATMWIFAMKNRHGWRDKHEVKTEGFEPLVIEMPSSRQTVVVTKKGAESHGHPAPPTNQLPPVPVLPAQPTEKGD